jgi:hypothetical protein
MDRTHAERKEQNRLPKFKQPDQQQSAITAQMFSTRTFSLCSHLHPSAVACRLVLHGLSSS